jgi:gas vesicle protein
MNDESKLGYFCLGCAVGVALGVLFAPKSGEDTVAYLQQKEKEGADYAQRTIDEARDSVNKAAERAKKAVNHQAEKLSAAVQAGKQAYTAGTSTT